MARRPGRPAGAPPPERNGLAALGQLLRSARPEPPAPAGGAPARATGPGRPPAGIAGTPPAAASGQGTPRPAGTPRPPPARRSRPAPAGTPAVRLRLDELGQLARVIKARAAAERAEAQARQAAERQRHEAADAFRRAVADVTPLAPTGRREPDAHHPLPLARQRQRDEQQALAQSLSDEIDIERLLESDETLSFRRAGVGLDALGKLRRGHWVVQAQLDLHGLRTDEAREHVVHFIAQARRHGLRCVRVIHGKGLGSVGRQPVLKDKVLRWLTQQQEVIAFCQAPPFAGGSGALLVLLRSPVSPG